MNNGRTDFFAGYRLRDAAVIAGMTDKEWQRLSDGEDRAPGLVRTRFKSEPAARVPLPDPTIWPLESGNVYLVGLDAGSCRFPVGEETGYLQMFCGRTVSEGPYCERCETERVKGRAGRPISAPVQ